MLLQHFLGTAWSNQIPVRFVGPSDRKAFPSLGNHIPLPEETKLTRWWPWISSSLSSFPAGLRCRENVLGRIGWGCFFHARCLCLFQQAGIQENPCKEAPCPCRELCLRLLEHRQGGSWGTPWCRAGARNHVWGTGHLSVLELSIPHVFNPSRAFQCRQSVLI